nr:MAG TPA: hypothetical protein [Caudoviricetes sp.]
MYLGTQKFQLKILYASFVTKIAKTKKFHNFDFLEINCKKNISCQ